MPLSKYCKIYRHSEDPNQVTLFSTLTTAVADVSTDLLRDLDTDKLSKEEMNTLTKLGLLVKSAEAEQRELLNYIEDRNADNNVFTAIVVLNLDCNLGCKYCYEGSRKGKHYMSADIADDFIAFVKSGVFKDMQGINITFYGGEPLLSLDTINHISKSMKKISKAKDLDFTFSFITNGTLLTPQLVKKLKPLGMRAASVTLDGPKEVHDLCRPFKSGAGSFDVIVRNIRDVCSLTDIQVGGNYTRDNYREFPRLLDHMLDTGLTPDRISSVKFDPVFRESSEFFSPDFHEGCTSINEPWLVEAGDFLRDEILKRGYRTSTIEPVVCFMELKSNVVVNYNGDLYKCPGLVGREEFRAGKLRSGMFDYGARHSLDNWKNEKCLACSYLPLCFGGCRYMKLVRDGDMNGVDCKKQYLDAILEKLVLQDVKYGL
jgi:uncharacterized protein